MNKSPVLLLMFLASFALKNPAYAQYCTPLYGFQLSPETEEVFSVKINPTNGSVFNFSTLKGSNGVITSTLDVNDKLMFYIEKNIPRFLPVNSVTGEPLSSGIFNAKEIVELEYHCKDKSIYGFSNSNNAIELVTVNWQDEIINTVHTFTNPNGQVKTSAIDAKGDFIFMVSTDNILYTYNLSTNTETSTNLTVDVVEIEYDINDDIIYAFLENGSFGYIDGNTFVQTGNVTIPVQEPTSTAFDPFTDAFFISSGNTMYELDAKTGEITSEQDFATPIHRLNAGIPCQIEADFYPENTCIDLPVQFIDASVGATEWRWDFGDGIGTSTEQNPVYNYPVAGMYEVNLEVSGCELGIDDTTIVITITEQPIVDLGPDLVECGNSYRIYADEYDPSFDLEWRYGIKDSTSFNVTKDGDYWLSVKNGSCFGTDTVNVTLLDTPDVDLGDDISVCQAEDINLNARNDDFEHLWSTGETSQRITATETGIYWVEVSNGICSERDSIEIKLLSNIQVDLGNDVETCEEEYQLDAGDFGEGVAYSWSTGASTQTITVTESNNYEVEVSIGDCSSGDEIMVDFNGGNLDVSLGEDKTACEGETVLLELDKAADSYLWNDGSTASSLEVTEAGMYSVEVKSGECTTTAAVQVDFIVSSSFNLGRDTVACSNDFIVLSGPPGNFNYAWSNGENTQNINVNTSGNYSLTIDNNGCTATDDITVSINPIPVVDLGEDQTICLEENQTAILSAGESLTDIYIWSNGETTPSIETVEPGIYSVAVQNENGCLNMDEVLVIEQCTAKVFVPSAFSPNGDNTNDIFKPIATYVESYALKVFNRYGQMVFNTTDLNEGWDGTFKNNKQPVGVFSWAVEFTNEGGVTQIEKGNVTLIR